MSYITTIISEKTTLCSSLKNVFTYEMQFVLKRSPKLLIINNNGKHYPRAHYVPCIPNPQNKNFYCHQFPDEKPQTEW